MVLASSPLVQNDIEVAFGPEDCESYNWYQLVQKLTVASEEQRLEVWKQLVETRQAERAAGDGRKASRRQPRHRERDEIIASCLARGMERREVCRTLDQKGIPTTAGMEKQHVHSWLTAWEDPELRNNVQQVFSKVTRRKGAVKS
jgi:hypothetical protein